MVPVDSLTAGNDGGTPPGSGQPADHPRDGRQLLHRPWTARNGRYLPQGPKDQVTQEEKIPTIQLEQDGCPCPRDCSVFQPEQGRDERWRKGTSTN